MQVLEGKVGDNGPVFVHLGVCVLLLLGTHGWKSSKKMLLLYAVLALNASLLPYVFILVHSVMYKYDRFTLDVASEIETSRSSSLAIAAPTIGASRP